MSAPARLVVAVPPEEAALALLDSALVIAARLEREMVALLVEDRRLAASAALPFTRIVSAAGEREFDVALAERMLRAVAERVRLRLERTAASHRVRWRLETAHGLEALPLDAGDVLAVATASAFWAEEPPARLPCPVLVMGRTSGPLVVVHRAGRRPALELARELARRAQLPLVVLACDPAAAQETRTVLGEETRIEAAEEDDPAALAERLRAIAPAMVLIEVCEDSLAWRAAVEALRGATPRSAA